MIVDTQRPWKSKVSLNDEKRISLDEIKGSCRMSIMQNLIVWLSLALMAFHNP